jgi:hypothetical protein
VHQVHDVHINVTWSFLNGEPETARMMLRELVNATVGFEQLADPTGKPAKSLHTPPSVKYRLRRSAEPVLRGQARNAIEIPIVRHQG